MNHQRLARTLISSAPRTNRSLLSIQSFRALSRSYSQKPVSTTSTASARPPHSAQQKPHQPKRDPESRFKFAYTPTGASSSHRASAINAKSKWDKASDDLIVQLHQQELPWIEIDRRLGRPASSCYNRYYTVLDPNLQLWNLPHGQPNTAMLKRLVYLVEVEKIPYGKIEKQGLLDGFVARKVGMSRSSDPAKDKGKGSAINKVTMIKKYKDYKILLSRQSFREGQAEISRIIRRNVELYGENWVKVAASVQAHMNQWHAKAASAATAEGSESEKDRRPLTPAFVKEIYIGMQEKGVHWGLEDDVVMARKVLELSQRHSNILDILAKKPSSSTLTTADDDAYWKEISIALGNHSPEQCRRRWQGLWELGDSDKSAQSKMWHRYEKLQFWMLWQNVYWTKFSMSAIPELDRQPLTDLAAVLEELSFAKEISRWMRHRSEAQCVKQFSTAVRMGLLPSPADQSKKEQPTSRADQAKLKIEQAKAQQVQDQKFLKQQADKFPHRKALLDAIQGRIAGPTITKLSTIDPVNELSTRRDPHQQIVRSDWTVERSEALQELVLQAKQGVERADFELDWKKIAQELETQEQAKARAGETVHITGSHCQKCWEYISAGLSSRDKDGEESSQTSQTSSEWSDLEIKLLQQGVRRFGTSWADIRAQFLPNRDVSELYPKWKSVADESKGTVDRLQEPDFVGLMSALDKVGKEKSK
ncbi:hypothetical protein BGZ82_007318 [Podila clonocystis]|nr:hypothetical protein BGZ82_007318 [Podila clonocystis]